MKKAEVILMLKAREAELRNKGVEALYLFGSVARDEAGPDSDVDLFFDPAWAMGWEYFSLCDEFSDILKVKTDAMSRRSLHPVLRADIEASAEKIF